MLTLKNYVTDIHFILKICEPLTLKHDKKGVVDCNHLGFDKLVFTYLGLRQKNIRGQKNSENVSLWFLKKLNCTARSMLLTEGGWTTPSIVEDDKSFTEGICLPSRLPYISPLPTFHHPLLTSFT